MIRFPKSSLVYFQLRVLHCEVQAFLLYSGVLINTGLFNYLQREESTFLGTYQYPIMFKLLPSQALNLVWRHNKVRIDIYSAEQCSALIITCTEVHKQITISTTNHDSVYYTWNGLSISNKKKIEQVTLSPEISRNY